MVTDNRGDTDDDGINGICVQVFAKITASVSHEIKNVLAIINENGGLLDDLVMMAGPEGDVPSARITAATTTIARQVQRANVIMKNINRFAHLGDTPVREEPAVEILGLMAALADRQAAMKNIGLSIDCSPELRLTAPMQALAAFIYLLFRGAVDISAHDSSLHISGKPTGTAMELAITGRFSEEQLTELASSNSLTQMLEHFDTSLECSTNSIQFLLPLVISPGDSRT